jgi:drug/metabolite transporter (DMT)-like permease
MTRRTLAEGLRSPGVLAALGAAVLFGLGTPLAKNLLEDTAPWLLAGLLYMGSGIGLSLLRLVRPSPRGTLGRGDFLYLAGAVLAGGVAGPVLLMYGLALMPASAASLLLNAEGILTALLAWIVFRENVDRRIVAGMIAIAAGAVVLSWKPSISVQEVLPALLVLGACLAWAIDNNLTRKIALLDATWLASVKGFAAGTVNISIALALGTTWPHSASVAAAMGIGALAYGLSLVLFLVGLRNLGTARTAAYFSMAPFIGALVAIVWLREPVTVQLLVAAVLMGFGLWLHLTERHEHVHSHLAQEHEHEHVHDDHHQHPHDGEVAPGTRHTHGHRHEPMTHSHHHFPDAHHQHGHDEK